MRMRGIIQALLLGAAAAGCAAEGDAESELTLHEQALEVHHVSFDVSVRESGAAALSATVYRNSRRGYLSVLALHGLAETAASFEPLASAIFRDRSLGRRVAQVTALDLIGHGRSGFPESLPAGVTFGQLTIDDNVSVVLQVLEQLHRERRSPQVILAHSMGGLTIQAVQQVLLDSGSSLAALGVRQVILLAPVPPRDRPWQRPPAADLSAFVVQDPPNGPYVDLPPALFVAQAFSTLAGTVAPNAPTPEVVEQEGYSAVEPLITILQLTDSPVPLPDGTTTVLGRPRVSAGAFAARRGTALVLASFSEDTLVPAGNLPDLYGYLSGDTTQRRLVQVVAPDAVHSIYISNPVAVVEAVREAL